MDRAKEVDPSNKVNNKAKIRGKQTKLAHTQPKNDSKNVTPILMTIPASNPLPNVGSPSRYAFRKIRSP